MRGLPWGVLIQDIEVFFAPLVPKQIQILYYDNGTPTGQASVEFQSDQEQKKALEKNKQLVGNRYIEISNDFRIIKGNPTDSATVILRELPMKTEAKDVLEYFRDYSIHYSNITLTTGPRGSKEAHIKFANHRLAQEASSKSKGKLIHNKVIDLAIDIKCYPNQHLPLVPPKYVVRIAGIPFNAQISDLYKFFEGLEIADKGIKISLNRAGRNNGLAFVKFANEQSYQAALLKDNQYMGHRYLSICPYSMEQ
eukprot:gene9799-11448_t